MNQPSELPAEVQTIISESTERVGGIEMVSIPLDSLVAATQWLRRIHENREEPTIKAWLRHDADPLPLLRELEDFRMVDEIAKEAHP